jgi:hypothetical protein
MCCLKYEQEAYEDLIRNSPKVDSFVDTPEGRGTVVELDLLRSRVKVRLEDAPETVSVFANDDIAVFRNGKAKKNDPPVPVDWAPISGSGKRVRKEPETEKLRLDPIRFRYSTEAVVEEPEEEPEAVRELPNEDKTRRSRRNHKPQRPQKPQPEQPAEKPAEKTPEKPKKQDKPKKHPAEPKKEPVKQENPEEKPDQPRKPRRRPPFHHRRPKAPGENNA